MVHGFKESVLTAACQPRGRLPASRRRCVSGEREGGRGGGRGGGRVGGVGRGEEEIEGGSALLRGHGLVHFG